MVFEIGEPSRAVDGANAVQAQGVSQSVQRASVKGKGKQQNLDAANKTQVPIKQAEKVCFDLPSDDSKSLTLKDKFLPLCSTPYESVTQEQHTRQKSFFKTAEKEPEVSMVVIPPSGDITQEQHTRQKSFFKTAEKEPEVSMVVIPPDITQEQPTRQKSFFKTAEKEPEVSMVVIPPLGDITQEQPKSQKDSQFQYKKGKTPPLTHCNPNISFLDTAPDNTNSISKSPSIGDASKIPSVTTGNISIQGSAPQDNRPADESFESLTLPSNNALERLRAQQRQTRLQTQEMP